MQKFTETENEFFEHHKIEVEKGQNPMRIDSFLAGRIENISRSKIKAATKRGNILVNNKIIKSNYKIKPNDIISIIMSYPKKEFELIPENIALNIIYEDEDLLIVNKEAGMVVHPASGNFSGTLVNALAFYLKGSPLFDGNNIRAGIVHRIDKNTSGLLLVAKTEKSASHLSQQFLNRTIDRKYFALVWGNLKEKEGRIEGNIGRSLKNRKIMNVFPNGDFGKNAVTHYKIVESFSYVNLIECKLETGRTHQIRVHLKYIGHPLFNDKEYGGDRILKGMNYTKYKQFVENTFKLLPRQALHAKSLGFIHPRTNKYMFFDSEIPEDMRMALDKWRKYILNRNTI